MIHPHHLSCTLWDPPPSPLGSPCSLGTELLPLVGAAQLPCPPPPALASQTASPRNRCFFTGPGSRGAIVVGSAQQGRSRQGVRRGSPLGFCLTAGAWQGNPTGPKRKAAAEGLGEDRETPLGSQKMGNPGWGQGRGRAGREPCGHPCTQTLTVVSPELFWVLAEPLSSSQPEPLSQPQPQPQAEPQPQTGSGMWAELQSLTLTGRK